MKILVFRELCLLTSKLLSVSSLCLQNRSMVWLVQELQITQTGTNSWYSSVSHSKCISQQLKLYLLKQQVFATQDFPFASSLCAKLDFTWPSSLLLWKQFRMKLTVGHKSKLNVSRTSVRSFKAAVHGLQPVCSSTTCWTKHSMTLHCCHVCV